MGNFDEELEKRLSDPDRWAEDIAEEEKAESIKGDSDEPKFIESVSGDPLALIMCGGQNYIGGVIDADDNMCRLSYPLIYMERMSPSSVDHGEGGYALQIGFINPYASLNILGELVVKPSTMYLLDGTSEKDIRLAQGYNEQVKGLLAAAAGIISPNAKDFSLIQK